MIENSIVCVRKDRPSGMVSYYHWSTFFDGGLGDKFPSGLKKKIRNILLNNFYRTFCTLKNREIVQNSPNSVGSHISASTVVYTMALVPF